MTQFKKISSITPFIVLALLIITPLILHKHIVDFHQKIEDKPIIQLACQSCNLQDTCYAKLPTGDILLNITPKIVTYMQPINIELNTTKLKATRVTAEFIGKNMQMGLLPFNLKTDAAKKRYKGSGSIVFCTIDPTMKWLLEFKLETTICIYSIAFELIE